MNGQSKEKSRAGGILVCLFALILWELFSKLGDGNKLPSPWAVSRGLMDLALIGLPPGSPLAAHLLSSLYRVFSGFLLASTIAIPLGLMMGFSERLRSLLNPLVEVIRPVPPLAWVPLAILWLGIGNPSAIFIICLGCFFPVLLNTVSGVEGTPGALIETACTLGAGRFDVMVKVILPAALPSIITGLRIGMDIGWMTLVAAEFTGIKSGHGLGYVIMVARDLQRTDQIIAGMAVIGFLGYALDHVCRRLERKTLRWR